MEIMKLAACLLRNLQIQSALIWAAVIIACTIVTDNMYVAMILTTAAGWHVLLLSAHDRKQVNKQESIAKAQ